MHVPHYRATIYRLSLLGDLGLRAEDARVIKGIEAVLQTQRDDGGFPGHDPRRCAYGPYDVGLVVRFMHQFGLGDDPRVEKAYGWIKENQTPEGGWVGEKGECNPTPGGCLNGTANVLWGLATSGEFVGKRVAKRGIEYLTKSMRSPRLQYARQLSYPQFWNFWIDDIKLAEIFIGIGVNTRNETLRRCLEKILSLQGKDGRWLEQKEGFPDRFLKRFFPRRGQQSKWVTAKAMIVLRRAHVKNPH